MDFRPRARYDLCEKIVGILVAGAPCLETSLPTSSVRYSARIVEAVRQIQRLRAAGVDAWLLAKTYYRENTWTAEKVTEATWSDGC